MGIGEIRKRKQQQQQRQRQQQQQQFRGWLIDLSLTALCAASLLLFGHLFSRREGRRIGGDRKKYLPRNGKRQDNEDTSRGGNAESQSQGQAMPLDELRLQRLKAVEERLNSTGRGSSALRLTPLGIIMELKLKVDRLEEEINFLVQKTAAGAMTTVDEKEQKRLLELLALLQLEVDGVKADESVRPHRKTQTNRIQSLIITLDKLKGADVDIE